MTGRSRGGRGRLAVLALAALAAAGCGATPVPPTATTAATAPAATTASPANSPTPSPAAPSTPAPTVPASAGPAAAAVAVELVAEGLDSPLLVANAGDGSGRLFVVEQAGRIRVIRDGRLLPDPYLDIRARVASGGERGLLGLAFDPSYATTGRFYVDYTDRSGNTVVAGLVAPDPEADRADPDSEQRVLGIEQPFANHNGGSLVFGPDGLLWIGTGDGGSGGDPFGNGQRLDTLLGKLLRIEPQPAPGVPYAIPADNPYARLGGTRPEIWASGLRNPWRFSFDRRSGDLWIGDVGQGSIEEIDRWPAGSKAGPNFGWNVMEGTSCFDPPSGCDKAGLVPPVAEYRHDQGCAVTGGYVYRGSAVPALVGTYLYADFCSGTVWGLDAAAPAPTPRVLLASGLAVASFGEGEDGELYLADLAGGRIFRVVAAP